MTSFDERAATWDDDPAQGERARVVAAAIREAIDLNDSIRLLDYGAGTGLVSQALQDDVGPITLVDPSSGMRDVMEAKISAGALRNAQVWDLDLEHAPVPEERFDVIVTVMTMHHVGDVDRVLAKFATLLDAGGRLCVVDLEREDGSFHGPDVHVHHGFERDVLRTSMRTAGFTDVQVDECHRVERETGSYPLLLAIGRAAD